MNRFKREEVKKCQDERKGLTHEQIVALDLQEIENDAIQEFARKLHTERFPLENGMPESNDTWELCLQDGEREIKHLLTRIDEIMFYKWDPLQLSDTNWPRYEYDSHVPEVFRLALESTSHHPIAEYLTHVSTDLMGMTEDKERDLAVAELIFSIANNQEHFPNDEVFEVE
jgi:hypothetical protein